MGLVFFNIRIYFQGKKKPGFSKVFDDFSVFLPVDFHGGMLYN
jgi:hypothetical protein